MAKLPDGPNKDAFHSWQIYPAATEETSHPVKRARVALACQRCKLRKQKCDGAHPSCSKCRNLGAACEYVLPSRHMPFGKNHYLRALEKRVAELESYLMKEGLRDVGSDHWQYLPQPTVPEEELPPPRDKEHQQGQSVRDTHQADTGSSSEDADESDKRQAAADSMIAIMRDLSLDANGGYMGATAHITMGRLVGSMVKGKNSVRVSSKFSSVKAHLNSRTMADDDIEYADSAFTQIPALIANRMLAGYLMHMSTAFPVIHSPKIRDLHSRRALLDNSYEICVLHLIYAIGGRFLETTGEAAGFFPERHHTAALKLLDEILQFHDSRSVQVLMLLAIYCLRAPQGPGAWTYVGLAVRIAIDIGLHRRTSAMSQPSIDNELRKRLFWSCYNLDRQVSIPLGRPFAISDRDVDVPLPLDVDEATEDVVILQKASEPSLKRSPTGGSTLSAFVHLTKLRIIESEIQQNVYRVDRGVEISDAEMHVYFAQLAEWKATIPVTTAENCESEFGPTNEDERYMLYYYSCLRLLLYPQVSRPQVNAKYLKECAEACGGVCRTYKRLHQRTAVGYSLMALQSVFMADPNLIFNSVTSNDIYACSIVLFVITERWPGATKYRDAFEVVKQNVIDVIVDGKHAVPRQTVVQLKTELQSTLHNLRGDEDQQDECSRILTDMAGERIDVERGALLTSEFPQNGSGSGIWQQQQGYGPFSSQAAAVPSYSRMSFDEYAAAAARSETMNPHHQTSGLFPSEFDFANLPDFVDWSETEGLEL